MPKEIFLKFQVYYYYIVWNIIWNIVYNILSGVIYILSGLPSSKMKGNYFCLMAEIIVN